jgi:hypothetical protein
MKVDRYKMAVPEKHLHPEITSYQSLFMHPLGLIHGGGFHIYSLPQCLYCPLRALDAASGGKGGTTDSHYLWITPTILK